MQKTFVAHRIFSSKTRSRSWEWLLQNSSNLWKLEILIHLVEVAYLEFWKGRLDLWKWGNRLKKGENKRSTIFGCLLAEARTLRLFVTNFRMKFCCTTHLLEIQEWVIKGHLFQILSEILVLWKYQPISECLDSQSFEFPGLEYLRVAQ